MPRARVGNALWKPSPFIIIIINHRSPSSLLLPIIIINHNQSVLKWVADMQDFCRSSSDNNINSNTTILTKTHLIKLKWLPELHPLSFSHAFTAWPSQPTLFNRVRDLCMQPFSCNTNYSPLLLGTELYLQKSCPIALLSDSLTLCLIIILYW